MVEHQVVGAMRTVVCTLHPAQVRADEMKGLLAGAFEAGKESVTVATLEGDGRD